MKPYGIIYKATNLSQHFHNECYIGQTTQTLYNRKYQHIWCSKNGSGFKFHQALNDYGVDCFSWTILQVCYSREELESEINWIKNYNSVNIGYNLSPGGNIPPEDIMFGNKNPRYNDHRTWEQLHGKEKADIMKKEKSTVMKTMNVGTFLKQQRDLKHDVGWNPMNDEVHRNKIRDKALGSNNSQAKYHYKIITPVMIYETDCMRDFCRKYNLDRKILSKIATINNYQSRDINYRGWIVIKTPRIFTSNTL